MGEIFALSLTYLKGAWEWTCSESVDTQPTFAICCSYATGLIFPRC